MFRLPKRASNEELDRLAREKEEMKSIINTLNDKAMSARLEKKRIQEELDGLRSEKKIEEEEIKHMIKMREERQAIALERKEIAIQKDADEQVKTAQTTYRQKIQEMHEDYRHKVEEHLESRNEDMKNTMEQVLARLPDIKMLLGDKDLHGVKKQNED